MKASALTSRHGKAAGAQGPAHRRLIYCFSGRNYVVEREDDMLNVYLVSAGPLPLAMTGDAAKGRMPPQRMQAPSEVSRKRAAAGQ